MQTNQRYRVQYGRVESGRNACRRHERFPRLDADRNGYETLYRFLRRTELRTERFVPATRRELYRFVRQSECRIKQYKIDRLLFRRRIVYRRRRRLYERRY